MMNKKKNIAVLIAAVFLFLALFDGWPYGFFVLLRFVVFTLTAYIAWIAHQAKQEKWTWIFGFIAVIFNPFIPLHFGRDFWVVIDFIVAIFLVISIFVFKFPKKI
jgi:hypothetical protein